MSHTGQQVWIAIQNKDSHTALQILRTNSGNPDIYCFADPEGDASLFLTACEHGLLDVLEEIIHQAASDDEVKELANQVNRDGCTSLMGAALGGHAEVIHRLLAVEGIDREAVNADGETAAAIAARLGREDIVAMLQGK